MRIKTQWNKNEFKNDNEITSLPSRTIPDQTMSIPELIRRYAQGLPLGAPAVAMYDEDPENDILAGINWSTLDLSEKHNFIRDAKDELMRLSTHFNKEKPNTPQTVNTNTELTEENNE